LALTGPPSLQSLTFSPVLQRFRLAGIILFSLCYGIRFYNLC
jgi:hypothetical protein